MSKYQDGYDEGRKMAADSSDKDLAATLQRRVQWVSELFPTASDIDLVDVVRAYDRQRLAAQPDAARFPELQGMADLHRGRRDGFRDATGLDEAMVACQFSLDHYWSKVLNCTHVARWDLQRINSNACTNVYIPEGAEGVTVADNRDISLVIEDPKRFSTYVPETVERNHPEMRWVQGGVSAALLLDEQPEHIFPCTPSEMLPDDCRNDINAIKDFMTRYADFWGPSKQIWVDRMKRAVGVEKTNRRIGFIEADPQTGAVAVTACSYITPELAKLRDERLHKVAQHKGESWEDSLDRKYTHGADKRQHRLLKLTFAEARRPGGATLWGALGVVSDRAVPYPDCVCIAGETCSPERQSMPEWSVVQHAAVISGPNRRTLYRSIEDMDQPNAVTEYTPKLKLGEGVEMKPEWQAEINAGKCKLG